MLRSIGADEIRLYLQSQAIYYLPLTRDANVRGQVESHHDRTAIVATTREACPECWVQDSHHDGPAPM